MSPTEWALLALSVTGMVGFLLWDHIDGDRTFRRISGAQATGNSEAQASHDVVSYPVHGGRVVVNKSDGLTFLVRRKLRPISVPAFQVTDRTYGTVLIDDQHRKVLFLEGASVAGIMEGSTTLLSLETLETIEVRDRGNQRERGRTASVLVGGALLGPVGAAIGSLGADTRKTIKGELFVELRFTGSPKPVVKKFPVRPFDREVTVKEDAADQRRANAFAARIKALAPRATGPDSLEPTVPRDPGLPS